MDCIERLLYSDTQFIIINNENGMQQASLCDSQPSLAGGYSSHDETVVIPAPVLSSFPMEASLMCESVQHPNSNGYISSEKNDRHYETS